MQQYEPYLKWIDHQKNEMEALVTRFANINSHSKNIEGLELFRNELKSHLLQYNAELQELNLPPHIQVDDFGKKVAMPLGKALFLTKRPEAPIKVFLCGHMDTVYGKDSSFQKVVKKDSNRLIGPGVADMKGGLVILLTALQAFEKSPYAQNIGWELLLTPDEEIGSPGSRSIIERSAKRNHIGLIFEPSFSDGALVSQRGGSMYFTVVARGLSAHAGRDFHEGSSAIYTILPVLLELQRMNSDELIVNIGELFGGKAPNIVPDLALAKVNIRSMSLKKMKEAKEQIVQFIAKDARLEFHEGTSRLPKEMNPATEKLLASILDSATHLGLDLKTKETRGVSDGNILAEFATPCIDTLGAVGGKLHSTDEYLELDSLVERAKLSALFLMKLGAGEYQLDHHKPPTIQL